MIPDINTLYTALALLKDVSSSNEKLKILSKIKEMDIAKDFFQKSLSPEFQFGLKSFPEYSKSKEPARESMYQFVEDAYTRLLHDKKDLRVFLESILETLTEVEYNLLVRICTKDPACGVSVATVNKIWPGLIDTGIKLQKAIPFSKSALDAIGFPIWAQRKEDGARCLCFLNLKTGDILLRGEATFKSSSGKVFHGLEDLGEKLILSIGNTGLYTDGCLDWVIDGELLVLTEDCSNDEIEVLSRQAGNGILNKSIKNTITKEEASRVIFVIWDAIPMKDYQTGKSDLSYFKRNYFYQTIALSASHLSSAWKRILAVETWNIQNNQELMNCFQEQLSNGYEGLILKDPRCSWEGKRVKHQIKMKLDLDTTLQVTGFDYGAKGTKYETVLGALHCQSSDGKVQVSVGSGFSDTFRQSFVNKYSPDPLFVEIRSNGLIESNGSYSLFLPRFIEIRTDKTEADSYDTIRALQDAACGLRSTQ